jgi:hypothetical protein
MPDYLHITNGDVAADILKASDLDGDVLPWRDPMQYGHFPADLDLDEVSRVRAGFLAGLIAGSEEISRDLIDERVLDFRLRNEHLKAAAKYREVILWFEHDLLDQLQILQVLDWFASAGTGPARLSLICIDRFAGIEPFIGIGQLNCDQMASLFDRRRPVTDRQLQLAVAGWAAFRSPNPVNLETFMKGDLAAFPFMRAALHRHLEEFPWCGDGLTRSERQILALVAAGEDRLGRIFHESRALETVFYMGDTHTFRRIDGLCGGRLPLLRCEPQGGFRTSGNSAIAPEDFRKQTLSLSDMGARVLAGSLDGADIIARDEWLGGVHLLSGQPMWTWDADAGQLKLKGL